MVVWLDGKSNTRAKPQENFGREIIELFTVGVGNYIESDVYAAARVFTGWNLRGSDDYRQDEYGDLNAYQEFVYNARPTRNQRQDVLVPDLQRTEAGPSRRAASRQACRTAST